MRVLDLGLAPYTEVQDLQKRLRYAVHQGRLDGAVLVLEHTPVITLGKHASEDDVVDPVAVDLLGVEIVRSERGGQSTLHAPGQLVAYPIFPIPHRDLRGYVHILEEVVLRLLHSHHLAGSRVPGRPGIYVAHQKIASVGLRSEHGVTSHGTALNVDLDLALFDLITSCGDPLLRQTSMQAETALPYEISEIKIAYVEAFSAAFSLPLATPEQVLWQDVEEFLGLGAHIPG